MKIIDIRSNSSKNILNKNINDGKQELHCLASKDLMPVGIPAFR